MRGIVYEALLSIRTSFTGPLMRNIGKRLYEVGTKIEGVEASEDRFSAEFEKIDSFKQRTRNLIDQVRGSQCHSNRKRDCW